MLFLTRVLEPLRTKRNDLLKVRWEATPIWCLAPHSQSLGVCHIFKTPLGSTNGQQAEPQCNCWDAFPNSWHLIVWQCLFVDYYSIERWTYTNQLINQLVDHKVAICYPICWELNQCFIMVPTGQQSQYINNSLWTHDFRSSIQSW